VPESQQQSFLSYGVCPPEVAFGCEYSTGRTPKLPKSKQQRPEWRAAVEAMLPVVGSQRPDHDGAQSTALCESYIRRLAGSENHFCMTASNGSVSQEEPLCRSNG
jgi:hypothetical protein